MEIYREDTSVVARYADRLSDVYRRHLQCTTLREGAHVVALPAYRGVALDVLDLSSLGTTGTFKDWLAAVAIAECLAHGHRTVLAQSSGNTANAVARYAAHAGIRCVILYPPASRRRILPHLAEAPGVHFVEVDAPEERIKQVLAAASAALDLPVVPPLEAQLEANKLRAYLLRDAALASGRQWDWHVQAVSSGFGPMGLYRGFREIRQDDPGMPWPRFLGVQQEAIAPYAAALTGTAVNEEAPMIEPTLFRRAPGPDLLARMQSLCTDSGGTVRVVSNGRYHALEAKAIADLTSAGVRVTHDADGQVRERAGLYSLAGTYDAVDGGLIEEGARVLAAYTGGSGPGAPLFEPEHRARAQDVVGLVAALTGLRRPAAASQA